MTRDASRRHPGADAGRRVLQAWRLPYRSDAAGRAGADHARPFRSRPRRPRRGAGDAGNARPDAAALRREFRRHDPGDRLWRERRTSAARRSRFHPAGHVLGSAQIAVAANGLRIVASGDYKNVPDPTCAPFELVPCDVFITEATFALPVFRHGDADGEIAKLLHSVALFPERAHLVGAYSLGKAQRVIALLRKAGYHAPIYLHGAMEKITALLREPRHRARRIARGARREQGGTRRHHRALPAVGAQGCLGAALSRSGHRLRLRLDAGARPRPPIRRRTAAGHFRSRRLGRPYRAPSPRPAPAKSGSPTARRTRWCTGARPAA